MNKKDPKMNKKIVVEKFTRTALDDDILTEEINTFAIKHNVVDIKYIVTSIPIDESWGEAKRDWITAFVHYELEE